MTVALMSSRLEAFAQLFTLLIVFIFVLAATYFATRFVGNYQKNMLSGSNIQILETMRISNTKYIQVIKVGGKCIAIDFTKDYLRFLSEFNEDVLIYISSSVTCTIIKESFKAVLEKFKKDKPEG